MVSRVIDVGGVSTFLLDEGAGDPLLLVHGSGPGITAAMSWDPVIEPLAAARRVLAVDMPGYGKSAPLPDADTPVNVAAHLERLLDELGIGEAAVVGHSRGGRIATELAILAPARVSSLAIIGSGSVAPGGHVNADGSWTEAAIALVNFGRDGDTSFERFREGYNTQLFAQENLPDEVLRPYYDESVSSGVLAHFIEQMRVNDPLNYYHKQDTSGFEAKLRSLRMPVLVVWGREDECSAYQKGLGLVDVIPDVEFSLLPRCGHFVMADQPRRFAQVLAGFLDGAGARAGAR
jgi:pimeloyl-ACP methyl ester carboxylesterase